jgi:hypothetical protein
MSVGDGEFVPDSEKIRRIIKIGERHQDVCT